LLGRGAAVLVTQRLAAAARVNSTSRRLFQLSSVSSCSSTGSMWPRRAAPATRACRKAEWRPAPGRRQPCVPRRCRRPSARRQLAGSRGAGLVDVDVDVDVPAHPPAPARPARLSARYIGGAGQPDQGPADRVQALDQVREALGFAQPAAPAPRVRQRADQQMGLPAPAPAAGGSRHPPGVRSPPPAGPWPVSTLARRAQPAPGRGSGGSASDRTR